MVVEFWIPTQTQQKSHDSHAWFCFQGEVPEMTTVTCDVAWYYDTISRDLTQANMHWNNVIKNVETNWKGLLKCKEDESPVIPTITKALPILKWAEAFQDFLHHSIGIRNIPLAYVV